MRRAGRLGDGWIPSFITPEQLRIGVERTAVDDLMAGGGGEPTAVVAQRVAATVL